MRRGIRRYFCNNCNSSFSSQRRPEKLQKIIFQEYFLQRQTLQQLSLKYNRSIPWIRKQILEYEVGEKLHNPRAINLVCDATFYGKKKDKLGTLVFKDVESKEILIWKHIESETVNDYSYLKNELIKLDLKKLLFSFFSFFDLYNSSNMSNIYKGKKRTI